MDSVTNGLKWELPGIVSIKTNQSDAVWICYRGDSVAQCFSFREAVDWGNTAHNRVFHIAGDSLAVVETSWLSSVYGKLGEC